MNDKGKTMSKKESVDAASMHPIVSTRAVWVFEVMDPPTSDRESWRFSKYIATEYETDSPSMARDQAIQEYGLAIGEARRRKITFEEYCALLRCKAESEHGRKVWQAMLRIVFTGSLSSV